MKIDITSEQVQRYVELTGDTNPLHRRKNPIIPGNLLVHYIIQCLELPPLKRSYSVFKKPVKVQEAIHLDYHQTDHVIEYNVTVGRELKLSGAFELKEE